MTTAPDPRALLTWVRAAAQTLHRTAATAPRGGGPRWQACLAELQVAPLPDEVRRRHLDRGAVFHSGPPPIELRRALERVVEQARALRGAAGAAPADPAAWDELDRSLDTLVDDEIARYLQAVRAPVTTASIFANAMATSVRPLAQGPGAGVDTLRCSSCGAPRQGASGAASTSCEFCGRPLLGPKGTSHE